MTIARLSLLAVAAAVLAGCASKVTAPEPASAGGKHLVYRDANGAVLRQFVYPDDGFCRRVEQVAGRGARCQADPVAGLAAKATLRYNPPGVLVYGQYADMARCRAETAQMAAGVELINPCAP